MKQRHPAPLEKPLTLQDSISYLLDKEGDVMKGNIRAKGKCPRCQGKFTEIQKLGFVCIKHQITPKRLYIDFFYQGQRYRLFADKSGQPLDSYQRAVSLLSRVSTEIENHTFDPTKYIKQELEKFYVSSLLGRFLDLKLAGDKIAPSYTQQYKRYVGIAIYYFGTKDVRDIRKLDIVNYQAHVSENYKWGNKTLKNCLDIFKTFLMYAKNDLEIINVVPHFPVIEIDPPITRWLTAKAQKAVFNHVPDFDKPIIAFLMLSGCRPGEARALKCRDVDLEHELITISATFSNAIYRQKRKGKKSKPVKIPIHPEILDYIKHRAENNLSDAYMFTNREGNYYKETGLLEVWRRARDKAGLDKNIRLYDAARHSYASQLINSGVSIYRASA
ncbi:phage integrase family protein [Candidatus Scalindua japonica]|uniref:Phage integrase family protein n=1 Tax=Candidatus Scalindua japonica TaxID=1284222 RepID=A0A286TVH5_9BACT|nr:tyrosine-type recombinase/integrase [Candidatus Scalindua japonica]GAX59892.1 phage integrase family protein [Candidatus Scalindua japonica]